ncbi:tRNA pseudouridine(38-40) synthase TruA [Algoriphagus marinus]|uniref:tRNA pseudouridine(38-40) synthase TruA n=1 Tax=Algoriphagus marinus TaxID=1925762 RepID=UPI00094BAA15|nr:tRNA pseudouridine(38-40) synthase TruA [Algoriphagus marinus]
MQSRPFSYLFSISYFGARYKGWAPQPNQPTVQKRLERVFRHVFGHEDFSLIGASRTDSGVSCLGGFVQLFLREKVEMEGLLPELKTHLPDDIRLNRVEEVPLTFNLIQAVRQKTYRYYFSSEANLHPFASAFLVNVSGLLDLELMREATQLFVGSHDFKAFCKASENKTDYNRAVLSAGIYASNEFLGTFFPKEINYFEVTGTGFLHHQVRKMMTALWEVSNGNWKLADISNRLANPNSDWNQIPPAPANGLILWKTILKSES